MEIFTVHGNGSASTFCDLQRRSLRHSELRPIGFYAQKGNKITLTVRGDTNKLVFAQIGIPDMHNTTVTPLARGENTFTAAHDGLLSFINKNAGCAVEITLDSELMRIPSFSLGVSSNETFFAEMDKYPKAPIILLSSKRADIVVHYNSAVKFLSDPDSLMQNVERFLQAQETISGLQANGHYDYGLDPNKMLYVEVDHGYMFATHGYMGFHGEAALKNLLKTQTSWGVWHESGHQMQQHPTKWNDGNGMTEVTVNLYSMAAEEELLGRASWLDNYYPQIHKFLNLEEKNYDTQDFPIKLGMLWQLRLAFGEAFYPQVHQAYRVMDELPTTSQERKNTFILVCSHIANINLIDYFDKWGIVASKKTRDLLRTLPPLTKKIWENDHNNTITLPLPYDKYLPQLHYIKKTVNHIVLSATEIMFSIEKMFIKNNDYIIKVNHQRVAEIKNGKSTECQLTEIPTGVVCSLPYDLANDDLVEVCLAINEDAYVIWQGSIDYITIAKRLTSLYADDKTIASWVTQADLDNLYKSIISLQHTNDLLLAYHDAQRLFLIPTIDHVNVTDTKINVLFNMGGIENYKYVILYNGKYLAELDKLKPYYSSWYQPNRWSITKPADTDLETICIEVRMSMGKYTLFEQPRAILDLSAEIDALYIDEDRKIIKPEIDQPTLSDLYQRIVVVCNNLQDNTLLREIDKAEMIFLQQSIQDVTLKSNNIQVSFFPEHYTELKYILIRNGQYLSEVNQGKAFYSFIEDDIWLTMVDTTPGDLFSIEVRVNDKKYTLFTQIA